MCETWKCEDIQNHSSPTKERWWDALDRTDNLIVPQDKELIRLFFKLHFELFKDLFISYPLVNRSIFEQTRTDSKPSFVRSNRAFRSTWSTLSELLNENLIGRVVSSFFTTTLQHVSRQFLEEFLTHWEAVLLDDIITAAIFSVKGWLDGSLDLHGGKCRWTGFR